MLGKVKFSLPYPDKLLLVWVLGLALVLWAGVRGSKDGDGGERLTGQDRTIRTEVIKHSYEQSLKEVEAALKLQPNDPRLKRIQVELKTRLGR